MDNLYSILGVESNSSDIEIKRAYFKLIRKFTPDKNEEKFKEIRYAFETLSDENARSIYDMFIGVPYDIQCELESAYKYAEFGDLKESIKIQERVFKKISNKTLKKEFGIICSNNGNFQKAASIFKEILVEYPDEYEISKLLGDAYSRRGWINKAVTLFEELIKSNPENKDELLIKIPEVYFENEKYDKAIEYMEKAINEENSVEVKSLLLEYKLMILIKAYPQPDYVIEKLTLEYFNYKKDNNDVLDDDYDGLIHLIMEVFCNDKKEAFNHINSLEKYIKTEKTKYFHLKAEAEIIMERIRLSRDTHIDKDFKYYLMCESSRPPVLDDGGEIGRLECEIDIIENFDEYIDYIKIIKVKYPLCYERISAFVKKMKSNKSRQRLYGKNVDAYNYLIKKFRDKEFAGMFGDDFDEEFEDDDEDDDDVLDFFDEYFEVEEPYKREEKKVGRNDPCPCGSGKKYKKCCINK